MRDKIFGNSFYITLSALAIASAFSLILSQNSFGQRFKHQSEIDVDYFPKNEIYIQYGSPTIMELVTMLPAPAEKGFKGDTKEQVFTGTPGLGYNFSIREDLSIGIFGGWSYSKASIYTNEDFPQYPNQKIYDKGVQSYVGQLSANWLYFTQGDLQISSGLYLGIAYWVEDIDIFFNNPTAGLQTLSIPDSNESMRFSYHITACKVRYGDTLGVFGELGFGFRGLLNIGLSIKL